ncbi:hypothetical protein PILCRDRAFT_4918 [Piloderma croceum F 1598]|uniref:Dephospho-CoA kinase n=1 Tax=Piloderma croceum (strain F 1598) TaxID=765440 RepID=A0A0C3BJB2_PILCF|nr:hypothetical protein PILCRDRAFT_4918 [Piloderma croceum F 1598]
MLVIGLTGGVATGKSTVSSLLKAKKVPIVDADILARQVVEPGTPALAKIINYFGPSILLPDGSLDRKQLGSIIFNDETKRKKLNSIVHPAVSYAILWSILLHWIKGNKMCIVDVPLLIEGGLWRLMGKVVLVYCPPDAQLQRLMKRDNSSREDASSRISSQLPITEKVEYADHIIDNSGSHEDLERQVNSFLVKVDKEVGRVWWRLSWLIPPFGALSALLMLAWREIWRPKKSKRKDNS